MKKYKIVFIVFCLFSALTFAQEQLKLQQAIEIALKNNYSISIAKNQEDMAKNEATIGNAGMTPQISINAVRSFSSNNTRQEYSNGTSVDKTGVGSNNMGSGIALAWTLFDGMKMFATYDKLKELKAMGELNAKIQIENKVEQIIILYYNIIRQKQLLTAIESTIAIYAERMKIAEEKWKIGNGSKSDFLQAQVDLNEQKSILLKQRSSLFELKVNLNQLMARKAETDYDVTNEIDVNTTLKLDQITNSALSKNNAILFYNRNVSAGELTLREIEAERFPQLMLSSSYNFSRTQNQVGFFLLNQNLGLNTGLTASWTLFNGFNVQRQIKNSQLSLLNLKLILENVKSQVDSDLKIAFKNYQSALETLLLEEENSKLAKENSEIMLERFRYGNATSLDIKTAQKSYTDALTRNIQARYDAKVAETTLLKLQGELVN